MLVLIAIVFNLLVLWHGFYKAVKNNMPASGKPICVLTSGVVLLISISFLYYLMLVANLNFVFLVAVLTIISALYLYINGKNSLPVWKLMKPGNTRGNLVVLISVLFFTLYFVLYAGKHGSWDAVAIWNAHAKFVYYPYVFGSLYKSNPLSVQHPDYPLMLPAIIAFFWHAFNYVSTTIPLVFAYLLLIAVPLFVYYALKDAGLHLSAGVALLVFLINSNFKEIAASQCADTLLSLLVLVVFVQYNNLSNSPGSLVYIMGFICGACGWVKNEGLLFCLVFTLFFIIANYKNIKALARYFTGLLIPLLIIISFKIYYAPANDLVSGENKQLTELSSVLLDVARYRIILKSFITTAVTNYPQALILVIALIIYRRHAFLTMPFAIVGTMLAAYFAIYLISPYNLNWHLYTSLYRVYQQLYPALVYLLLLSFGNAGKRLTTLKVSSISR